jgi:hypothetical protein
MSDDYGDYLWGALYVLGLFAVVAWWMFSDLGGRDD